jgi:GR25 family glycosyltransferase involved in LPS biosynthesis
MFTKIIYINLDRRPDRKENVINELNKIGINENNFQIERVPGVDWKTLDFNNIPSDLFTKEAVDTATDNTKPLYSPMTRGGIGCAMAHRNAFLSVLNSDADYVLILEDDLWFEDDFLNKLNLYLNEIPEYDILWLGYHQKTNEKVGTGCYDVPGRYLFGLFGYIINKKAAMSLLEIFPLTHQIDSEIPKIFPNLRVYALKENHKLVHSEPSSTETQFGTDIQIREDFGNHDYKVIINRRTKRIIFDLIIIFIIAIGFIYLFYDSNGKNNFLQNLVL